MRLWAISDLHLSSAENRDALAAIRPRPADWLALAGDVGETEEHLRIAFDALQPKFAQLVWTPGNHELWSVPAGDALRGERRYQAMVAFCRSRGVLTPEDPYAVASFGGRDVRVAPLFTLYDYSFRPPEVAPEDAVAWAREGGVRAADEVLLDPAPHADRAAWCRALCDAAEDRLEPASRDRLPTVLVNHWPLLESLARLPRIPRFKLWCGTTRTRDWHRRFNAVAAVSGHVHIRSTAMIDGVAFHEVSLGYPRDWLNRRDPDDCVTLILG